MQHIKKETNCQIWITGEPGQKISLELSAYSDEDLRKATTMVNDLIDKVYEDYDQYLNDDHGRGRSSRDGGKGKSKGDKGGYRDVRDRDTARSGDRWQDGNRDYNKGKGGYKNDRDSKGGYKSDRDSKGKGKKKGSWDYGDGQAYKRQRSY